MPDVQPDQLAPAVGGGVAAPADHPVSYRALLAIPWLGRALLGMQIARIAGSMLGVAIVLFSLEEYRSPGLAGIITFVSIFPGLVVSPIAGALLDRHGRSRLIVLDFLIATAALALIGGLSRLDLLPLPLLLGIAGLASFSQPLSHTGLRTLFPLMVPRRLWERLNALDSNGWVVASIIGPPIAAIAVGLVGGAGALLLIALLYGVAAIVVARVPEPASAPATDASGRLLVDAWRGLRYAWANRTIRGLGFSVSAVNVGGGMLTIVIPLIVLERLDLGEPVVGLVFAIQGLAGVVVGFAAGRIDTRGRERPLIAWPMVGYGLAIGLLIVSTELPVLLLVMVVTGVVIGPMDVAIFTLRQRRTDPAWMGRAFAVSMSFNFSGYPIGAAIGGSLAAISLELAIAAGVVTSLVGAALATGLIPLRGPEYEGASA